MEAATSPSAPVSPTNRNTRSSDVFAWEASRLPGVPREVIKHKLVVNKDAKPVKQVL